MRILLIRLRQIGDVVFTTPAVAALRRRYPDAQLTYLVEPPAAAIVSGNPHIDEVLIVPPGKGVGGFLADLALGWRLRGRRYNLAIDFHGGPRASLLTWLSRAAVRIGYDIPARAWMYTQAVARPRELRKRHSVLNQWDLLAPLGIKEFTPDGFPVEMAIDPEAATRVRARLSQAGVAADDALVVVHVSASSPFRRWPMASFSATVAALASPPHRRVIVTSGPSDRDAANGVITAARSQLGAVERERVVRCGDFSLAELRALLERSAVYIGGDSGPLHIAATTRVPIVALFGPTPSERSAPWRNRTFPVELIEVDGLECRPCDQRVCVPGDFRCLTRIEPAHVVAAAERVLARAAAVPRREPA